MVREMSDIEIDSFIKGKKKIPIGEVIGAIVGWVFFTLFTLALTGALIKFVMWSWNWLF